MTASGYKLVRRILRLGNAMLYLGAMDENQGVERCSLCLSRRAGRDCSGESALRGKDKVNCDAFQVVAAYAWAFRISERSPGDGWLCKRKTKRYPAEALVPAKPELTALGNSERQGTSGLNPENLLVYVTLKTQVRDKQSVLYRDPSGRSHVTLYGSCACTRVCSPEELIHIAVASSVSNDSQSAFIQRNTRRRSGAGRDLPTRLALEPNSPVRHLNSGR